MKEKTGLKIAILGTRGIPANYGGFETFAQELSERLAARGFAVTVYGRRFFQDGQPINDQAGKVAVRRIITVRHKYLETPVNALLGCLDLLFRPVDLVVLCNAANSLFAILLRLRGIAVLINVDGIERKRSKWNILGRWWYRLGELASVVFASRVIADAQVISDYYKKRYRCPSEVIGYGADPRKPVSLNVLQQFNLERGRYLLYVSRLEPENNALGVVQAYRQLRTELPLVVVGDAPYAKEYIEQVKREADQRVVFVGYQFGEAYRGLQDNCLIYIQATEVGGTHPALVAAMAYGSCIVANDVPEHREVLADTGEYYNFNDFCDLASVLRRLLDNPAVIQKLGREAGLRAKQLYSWDRVADQYEALFAQVLT